MHRVTDYYGPIVYSHFADPEARYMPNTQKEVYNAFFCELDTAVAVLSDYIVEHPGASEFARFDMLLDGDYDSWIKFANSLRMRLAMRIAVASPEKAKRNSVKRWIMNTESFGRRTSRWRFHGEWIYQSVGRDKPCLE